MVFAAVPVKRLNATRFCRAAGRGLAASGGAGLFAYIKIGDKVRKKRGDVFAFQIILAQRLHYPAFLRFPIDLFQERPSESYYDFSVKLLAGVLS